MSSAKAVRFFKLVELLYVMKTGTSAYTFTGRQESEAIGMKMLPWGREHNGSFFRVLLSNVPAFPGLGGGGAGIYFDWCITSYAFSGLSK